MIPRFDAGNFSDVTAEMQQAFDRDGVLVLDGLIPEATCDELRSHMDDMMASFDAKEHASVFSSASQAHAQDEYFLSSGHTTRFFFEEEAFDEDGNLTKALGKALNKVGHAMHDTDPVFNRFARQPALAKLATGLGLADPKLAQSMYIFKQPEIGGEVICHQDATYIRTSPNSCLGFWVALEEATEENGCLWGIPGGHLDGGADGKLSGMPKSLFIREGAGTRTEVLDETPYREEDCLPLPAPKGTVLVFGGLFPHMSRANRSAKSRHAYTLHVVDGATNYPADNWLQRPAGMPFHGF